MAVVSSGSQPGIERSLGPLLRVGWDLLST